MMCLSLEPIETSSEFREVGPPDSRTRVKCKKLERESNERVEC